MKKILVFLICFICLTIVFFKNYTLHSKEHVFFNQIQLDSTHKKLTQKHNDLQKILQVAWDNINEDLYACINKKTALEIEKIKPEFIMSSCDHLEEAKNERYNCLIQLLKKHATVYTNFAKRGLKSDTDWAIEKIGKVQSQKKKMGYNGIRIHNIQYWLHKKTDTIIEAEYVDIYPDDSGIFKHAFISYEGYKFPVDIKYIYNVKESQYDYTFVLTDHVMVPDSSTMFI